MAECIGPNDQGSSAGDSSSPSPRPLASQYSQLSLTVSCGRINAGGGLLKPNPYVEIIVDGRPAKKTETCKSTYQPRWNNAITVLVTPYSKILFRLYDHSTFKKDTLVGENTLNLFNVLKQRDGKCQKSTMSLELTHDGSKHSHLNGVSNSNAKVGELVVILDGLNVDMNAVPAASPPVVSVVPSAFLPEDRNSSSVSQATSSRRRNGDSSAERLPPLASTSQIRGASTSSLNSSPTTTNGEYELPPLTPDGTQPHPVIANGHFIMPTSTRRILLPPIHRPLG
jgi:hypothetical protein